MSLYVKITYNNGNINIFKTALYGGNIELTIETDYFKLLEDKIGELITRIQEIKNEKESFKKTIDDQKSQINTLTTELNDLKESKKQAKERITTIIEKIDKLAV